MTVPQFPPQQERRVTVTHLRSTHHCPHCIWRHDQKTSAATKKDLQILVNYETSCTLRKAFKCLKFWTHPLTGLIYVFHNMVLNGVYKQMTLRLDISAGRQEFHFISGRGGGLHLAKELFTIKRTRPSRFTINEHLVGKDVSSWLYHFIFFPFLIFRKHTQTKKRWD